MRWNHFSGVMPTLVPAMTLEKWVILRDALGGTAARRPLSAGC